MGPTTTDQCGHIPEYLSHLLVKLMKTKLQRLFNVLLSVVIGEVEVTSSWYYGHKVSIHTLGFKLLYWYHLCVGTCEGEDDSVLK